MDKEELKQQIKLLFEIVKDAEVIELMADTCWQYYTKLKEKGFNDDQALQLTTQLAKMKQ